MTDLQYGIMLTVFGGGLTLASLSVIVGAIYLMMALQPKTKK